MEFEWISLIGFLGGTCTTASFLPQVIKTLRSRRTKDLSLMMYAILTSGLFLWLVYGLLNHDLPIIVANGISCLLSSILLFLKIRLG